MCIVFPNGGPPTLGTLEYLYHDLASCRDRKRLEYKFKVYEGLERIICYFWTLGI